jgi:hypothetical protein
MLTLDAILNGLTEEQMDLVVGSRVQAGNKGHSYSHGSYSKKSKTTHRSYSTRRSSNHCYCPCYPY